MDRRKFFTEFARWILTGGLLGASALLLYRRSIGNPDDCYVNPFCGSCGQNSACEVVAQAKLKVKR